MNEADGKSNDKILEENAYFWFIFWSPFRNHIIPVLSSVLSVSEKEEKIRTRNNGHKIWVKYKMT